jgi:hypothetical protein
MSTRQSRLLRPPTSVFDHPRSGARWRGGQVIAIDGADVTLRVQAEASIVHDYTVAASLFAASASVTIGAPVAVRIGSGETPATFTIAEVRGALPSIDVSDIAGLVASGVFAPGVLNGCVPGCFRFQDEGE